MSQANFIRNSIAYKEDGTQVGINEPRFETGKFGQAIMVEEGTTNLLSCKLRATDSIREGKNGWERIGISNDNPRTVLNSTAIPVNPNTTYTFSCLYWSSNGVLDDVYIKFNDTGWPESTYYIQPFVHGTNKRITDLGNGWKYCSGSFTTKSTTATIEQIFFDVDVNGVTVFICNVQLEAKPYATSFIDGTRSPESLTIPTNILNPKQGTVELWVKVNDSMKYLVTNRYPSLFYADSGGAGKGIWLLHHQNIANFVFQIKNENNLSQQLMLPDSQVPNGWHHFAFNWDSNEAKLYLDGVLKGTMVSPYLPNIIQNIYVGCWGSAHQINSLIDDLRISNRVRTQEEILETYTKGFYAHADYFTTYKHSFDTINSEIYLPDNYYNIPWQDPVFNRTQEDVLEALRRIREWKENGGEFEELKGCLNVSDLMRIEYDTKYLSWILNEYYFTNTVSTKRWDMLGLPNVDDVNRIISNIQNIINSYYTHPDAPPLPNTMLTYSDINAIEENLFRIMEIIDSMKLSFQKSGMFKAAGRRILPLKRG